MISIQAPVCVAPTADICGEGAVWQAAGQALYWTDINRFLIHRLTPADGCVKTWFFDEPVTSLILTSAERTLAVVLGSRVVLWDPASGAMRDLGFYLQRLAAHSLQRCPCRSPGYALARVHGQQRQSRWLVGSIDGQLGKLFSVASDGSSKEWKSGIGVANTFAWNPAAMQFYFADTLANTVWQYQYDAQTPAISEERTFFAGFSLACRTALPWTRTAICGTAAMVAAASSALRRTARLIA